MWSNVKTYNPSLNWHKYKPTYKKTIEYKPTFEKVTEEKNKIEFPQKYRLNENAIYKFVAWNRIPINLTYYYLIIYITPKEKINLTFSNIFDDSEIKTSYFKKWFESPNLSFWAQALNFAVWCSTGGCGVSREMLTSASPQINSFYKFHIYFTIRRILNELQCPLPKDQHFSKYKNYYNKNAFEKLKIEFSTGNDFRYHGATGTKMKNQYEYFFPYTSNGLTKAGLSRINQTIEAFVYSILGSQVQTRSSIIGDSGSAQETQKVFLQLFESALIERDISKSIQRYQFALQQAKQKLDLAVALECWLCPSNLILNNSPIAGYNNKLQKATKNMMLGVNNINEEIIPIVKHNLGHSKKKHLLEEKHETKYPKVEKPIKTQKPKIEKHENNKAAIIIIIAGVTWFLFR